MKVLIIGGYGRFGGNLARLLSDCDDLTLFIAGRTLKKAQRFCDTYTGAAQVRPLDLDRNALKPILKSLNIDLVVDASGPFQIYGDTPYCVVETCIACRVPYLDLADSAEFVTGIEHFNAGASVANIFALSGVSTCPALSGAVVAELSQNIKVTDITIGIAPSPRAALGLSVIKAILSYAGTHLPTLRMGQPATFIGLTETRRFQIAPKGYTPLKNRLFSAVEAPDLNVFPTLYPELQNLWVGAATRPEILLRLLTILAKLKAMFNLPPLTPLAPLAHKLMSLCKFGPHRGGMFVEIKGEKDSQNITKNWHLIAEGDDGPLIPAMAADIIIRNMLRGIKPASGARPATSELRLQDFEARFAQHNIVTSSLSAFSLSAFEN